MPIQPSERHREQPLFDDKRKLMLADQQATANATHIPVRVRPQRVAVDTMDREVELSTNRAKSGSCAQIAGIQPARTRPGDAAARGESGSDARSIF